jgi:hypothetical protein
MRLSCVKLPTKNHFLENAILVGFGSTNKISTETMYRFWFFMLITYGSSVVEGKVSFLVSVQKRTIKKLVPNEDKCGTPGCDNSWCQRCEKTPELEILGREWPRRKRAETEIDRDREAARRRKTETETETEKQQDWYSRSRCMPRRDLWYSLLKSRTNDLIASSTELFVQYETDRRLRVSTW